MKNDVQHVCSVLIKIQHTAEQAKTFVEEKGFRFRITKIDGHSMIVTRDFNPERINVELESNVVTAACIG